MSTPCSNKFHINGTKWDQSCYLGRALHFFKLTNPLNIFATDKELDDVKSLMLSIKSGKAITNYSDKQLWDAKYLYDSAFHPETGEKQFLLGRMSAQVPCNMLITAGLLASYRSTPALIFFQWLNQSFNALVNYTNRSGTKPISTTSLMGSYVIATTGAVGTALCLNRITKRMGPLVQRLVPFTAVAAANLLNISVMRYNELEEGVAVYDKDNNYIGHSTNAAKLAIATVVLSRVSMSIPGMVLTPVVFNHMVKRNLISGTSIKGLLFQTLLCGLFLIFATPLCCAIFPQEMLVEPKHLEPKLKEILNKKGKDDVSILHFNKGL